MTTRLLVSVVDDDESVRESLENLLKECGFEAQAFSSGGAFLRSEFFAETRCLILDLAMPGMSGPDLFWELNLRGQAIPTIFITADGEPNIRPRLLKLGAVECLLKPFSDTDLLKAIDLALQGK